MKFILGLSDRSIGIYCFYVLVFFCFYSCSKIENSEIAPEYKIIKCFSETMYKKNGLVLYAYGVNNYLSKDYAIKKGVASYSLSYYLFKPREDKICLDEARRLLVDVMESFLIEINSNPEILPLLDSSPFSADFIDLSIYFKDENRIDLGSGISTIYCSNGKIKYERYEIHEYKSKYPAIGEHFIVHRESYAEALETAHKLSSSRF